MRYMKIKNDVSKKILSNIQKRNNKVYTNEIDIAIATDTNFIRQTQILISSFENILSNVNLHILNISLSEEDVNRIKKIAPVNVKINNIKISKDDLNNLKINKKWPIEAWARVLIPKIFCNKILLYLDVDCIVVDDISELFINDNFVICGVESPYYLRQENLKINKGVNSGVLLLNCNYLTNENFTKKILDYGKCNMNSLTMPDQDSINYISQNYMFFLNPEYNVMNFMLGLNYFRIKYKLNKRYYTKREILNAIENPKIIHFNGGPLSRPWLQTGKEHPYKVIYNYYNKKVMDLENE